ncbi:LOW QUALITY PROTEIN: CLOCK-interacting pacemaker [Cynoglossus semilaevis]|uniref:LOW QUALITY PROTEIN: CLOCK-interacting pacemaker n=1 Tax=Cynoglossus semilaevis TaxID=244447 RepID=UPI0007DCAD87|nr:LOW QUALITY PROTEIN: CLOCK-interacting pacemaker-like [Cynoglossus semilaevis]
MLSVQQHKRMSTKRKPETHSRASNQAHTRDSERDSGFSDASSDHLNAMDTTDSEDSPHPVAQQGPQSSGSGHQPSQLAVVGGSYSNISPMIIMNNMLLKQPGDNPPALKPWGFSPTVEVVQQPQVVFLQPVVSSQTPPTHKEATSRPKRSKKYLPILKSYPKIAPHPGDSSSGKGSSSSSSSSSSCTSSSLRSKNDSHLFSNQHEHYQKDQQLRTMCGSVSKAGSNCASLPGTPNSMSPLLQHLNSTSTPETSVYNSPSVERSPLVFSQLEFNTSHPFCQTSKDQMYSFPQLDTQEKLFGESDQSDSDAETKRKRFCNTYNILSKSGLLDITLRTKELLKQNLHTQNDLDRLREHTDLFLQALHNGDSSICGKLQARLQEEDGEREKARAVQLTSKADLSQA